MVLEFEFEKRSLLGKKQGLKEEEEEEEKEEKESLGLAREEEERAEFEAMPRNKNRVN